MATYCKYYKEEEYISIDGGTTWTAMGVYRKGDLLEYDSPDCGTPTPTFDGKFKATYTGGTTYSAACDDNTTLTSENARPSGYNYYAMQTAEIGSCITSIDYGAFAHCTGLTSVVIPSEVTSIGGEAFFNCKKLASVTVNATTPPALGNTYVFEGTPIVGGGNGYIYVPSASVNAYKSEIRWSNFASKIRPIT